MDETTSIQSKQGADIYLSSYKKKNPYFFSVYKVGSICGKEDLVSYYVFELTITWVTISAPDTEELIQSHRLLATSALLKAPEMLHSLQ